MHRLSTMHVLVTRNQLLCIVLAAAVWLSSERRLHRHEVTCRPRLLDRGSRVRV